MPSKIRKSGKTITSSMVGKLGQIETKQPSGICVHYKYSARKVTYY
jgi:hypothetical protein